MKNLKKVGAVALAAVMAVAFAPVSSLPVSAAYTPAGKDADAYFDSALAITDDWINTTAKSRTFYLTKDVGDVLTVTTDISIDLNGHNIPDGDLVVRNGATVTLTDGSVAYYSDGTVGTPSAGAAASIALGFAGTNNNKDDTEAGNLVVGKGVTITKVTLTKGTIDVKDGKVSEIETALAGSGNDTKDKEGLAGKSSIIVEGGDVTFGTINEGGAGDAKKGKEVLKATGGVTIKGGTITMGASISENPADVDGDFVTIEGGTFAAENFDAYGPTTTQAWTTKKFLNTTSEWALPIGIDSLTPIKEYYIGDTAIADAVNAGGNVTVVNGDAALTGIKANSGTVVNDVRVTDPKITLKGTLPTVTAKAESGASTLRVYKQEVDDNTRLPDTMKYFFGASAIKTEIDGADLDADTNDEYLVALDIDYAKDFDGADGKAGTDDDIKFDLGANHEYATTESKKSYVSDITYFTTDPSDRFAKGNEVGVIDGAYYVVSTKTGKSNAYKNATNTVEILKAKGWDKAKEDTTENQKAVSTFDVRVGVATNVTGPEDASVVVYNPTEKDVSLGGEDKNRATATAYVFGKSGDIALNKGTGTGLDQNTTTTNGIQGVRITAAELVVQNIVPATLTLQAIDKDVTIKTADGIDWYTTALAAPTLHDEYTYHFAKTDKANEEFNHALYGYTTDKGVKIAPKITGKNTDSGETRVSQGISGTYEKLGTAIKIDAEWAGGEQSSTLAADKSNRTWYVNLENKNLPRKVYRLRAKVGNNHLFTMDKDEADNAVASGDWVLENTNSFKMLPWNTTVKGAVKVLRFRNVKTNEFLFSTDPAEQAAKLADPEWAEGNVAFCGLDPESKEGYPVTRLFSTIGQGHLYSTAQAEIKDAVEKNFYHKDGVVFFAVETPEKEK